MGMTAREILTAVGDENVSFQNLQQAFTGAKLRKGGLTEVSFMTDAVTPTEIMRGTNKLVGMIIWMPKDKVAEVVAQMKAKPA